MENTVVAEGQAGGGRIMDQVSYDQNRRNGACLPNEKLNMMFLWILKGKWSLKP